MYRQAKLLLGMSYKYKCHSREGSLKQQQCIPVSVQPQCLSMHSIRSPLGRLVLLYYVHINYTPNARDHYSTKSVNTQRTCKGSSESNSNLGTISDHGTHFLLPASR